MKQEFCGEHWVVEPQGLNEKFPLGGITWGCPEKGAVPGSGLASRVAKPFAVVSVHLMPG
jgi:hypothetical protein